MFCAKNNAEKNELLRKNRNDAVPSYLKFNMGADWVIKSAVHAWINLIMEFLGGCMET